MVGGIVIGLTRQKGRTHVNVADCPHYPKHRDGDICPRPDTCCVYVQEAANVYEGAKIGIAVGDKFWWQGGTCFWTPQPCGQGAKQGVDFDIELKKIGYSH